MIAVSDWERSNAFYRDVLGAELVPFGGPRVAYRLAGTQLNVHGPGVDVGSNVARRPVQPGNSDLCFVWPGPIEGAVAHLERHQVEIEEGPVERVGARGAGTSVYFRDPDGSLLEFISYEVMDAEAAARAWVSAWRRAWPAGDPEPLAAVYADEAVYFSHPFRPRQTWRGYVEWAFADQAEAECRFGEPVVRGDHAAVDWWGVITSKDGSVETVAGTSLLRFGPDGRVLEQRDAWAGEAGRHELPHWAPAPGFR